MRTYAWRLRVGFLILLLCGARQSRAQDSTSPGNDARPPDVEESHVIPALEIIGFDIALNRFNNRVANGEAYNVGWSSIRRNLKRGWIVDHDEFKTNQFLHPYQ